MTGRRRLACGTMSGPTTHRTNGETVCADCSRVQREYNANRLRDPTRLQDARIRGRSRSDALTQLSRSHRTRYKALLALANDEVGGSRAQSRALTWLSQEFRTEYQALYQAAKAARVAALAD